MLEITVDTIAKVFPPARRGGSEVRAVDDVSCTIKRGEMYFLLGPSGCGKTTLLRILAGFTEPTGGRLLFDDRDVTALGPDKRGLAMVFQNYALWPHMTVADNVAFGPRTARWEKDRTTQAVDETLAMVDMADRAGHKPPQLSGGQQQRVALARALAISPRGLLLDEPLSNLDARLRARMRGEIRRIVKDSGATAVYVTHDQEEALSMADRIAVMQAGKIVQVGTPREVYRRPANRFVADFLGEANFIPGRPAGREGEDLLLKTAYGPVRVRCDRELDDRAELTCCFRPEALRPAEGGDQSNQLAVRCLDSIYLGQITRHRLALSDGRVMQALTTEPWPAAKPEAPLAVSFRPDDAVVLAD